MSTENHLIIPRKINGNRLVIGRVNVTTGVNRRIGRYSLQISFKFVPSFSQTLQMLVWMIFTYIKN